MRIDPDAIIFDFGGVLININYQDTIDAFKALGVSDFDRLYSQATQSELFDQYETGQISSQYFINQILKYLPEGTTPNAVVSAWNAMIKDVPESSINILKKLQEKGKKIYLLSNTNEIHIQLALKEWSRVSPETPQEIFDRVFLSYEVKMRKPDMEIFEYVISQENLTPERTLFIDDSIQHIRGAERVKLLTHHLTDQKEIQSLFS